MARSYRIKRYKRIYRRSISSIILQWVLILGGIGLLFFLGWKLYEPITSLFDSEEQIQQENDPPVQDEPSAPEIPETPAATPEIPQTEETPVETPQEEPAVVDSPAMKTAYLPEETVLDANAFAKAIADAKEAGMDSIMFDLKSRDGWCIYPISYKSGYDDYFTAGDTISLKDAADQIREAGMKPIASIYTFRDRRYQQAEVYAGILYSGTESFWLDNAPDAGGRSWLNPYSPLAKDYLKKLISDAAEAGFGEIVLREFRFPVGASMNMMEFVYDNGQSKLDCLKAVDDEFRAHAEELGVDLWIEYPANALNGGDERPYGGSCGELLEDHCIMDLSGCGTDSMELADIIASINHNADGAELAGMVANEAQADALQAAGIDHYILIK